MLSECQIVELVEENVCCCDGKEGEIQRKYLSLPLSFINLFSSAYSTSIIRTRTLLNIKWKKNVRKRGKVEFDPSPSAK